MKSTKLNYLLKTTVILMAIGCAPAAFAGGGPHERHEKKCRNRPTVTSPKETVELPAVHIADFDSVRDSAIHLTIAEQFLGQRTQYGNCGSTLKRIGPSRYVLIFEELSSVTYRQVELKRIPIARSELLTQASSTRVIGARISNSLATLEVSCITKADSNGFSDFADINGTVLGRKLHASQIACELK